MITSSTYRFLICLISFLGFNPAFAQTFSNGTDFAIPDNGVVNSTITASGLPTSLDCNAPFGLQSVCIKIAHTWDADLDIYLIAPDGTMIELSTDNGGSGDHYGNNAANDLGPYTCFDMSAATLITAGAAPFAGTYRPEGNLANANNGQNPNGVWTLRVFDDTGGDIGTILYWQLTFSTTGISCPPAGDPCNAPISITPGLPGATCSPVAGTTVGLTGSGTGCSIGTNDDDVWYSFVATSTTHIVTVAGGADFDPVIAAYSTCVGASLTGCIDNTWFNGTTETTTLNGLTVGATYYVQVYDYNSGSGTFTICVTTPGPPNCAAYSSPANGATVCSSGTNLTWIAPSGPSPATSYQMYFGTNNPPTNIVNGTNIGNVTTYATGALTVGTTYYWSVVPVNGSGTASNCGIQSFTAVSCVNMNNGTTTTCGVNFYDSGGPTGSYSSNQNLTHTFCPATAGQCIRISFNFFDLEAGYDYMYIHDGNSTAAAQFPGSPFSGTSPGVITGTVANATGCITIRFTSDNIFNDPGWAAFVSCVPCGTPPPASQQDCVGGSTVCSSQSFSGNSSGSGSVVDLNAANDGCLSGENQTSWYYFSPLTSGNIAFSIVPANGTDDYDFALWGPMPAVSCPPSGAPLRCSYSALSGSTGLNSTALDVTEGVGGDSWVSQIAANAGDVYILVIDNYSSTTSPFTLNWSLTGGATLDCTVLLTELSAFNAIKDQANVKINWTTQSESNSDYFIVERSSDGVNYTEIKRVAARGNSSLASDYACYDYSPDYGKNYYRLKMVDRNGVTKNSGLSVVDFSAEVSDVLNLFPNPTNGELNLELYIVQSGAVLLEYFDYTGRLVYSESVNLTSGFNKVNSSIETLPNGVYTLKVHFNAERTVVVKRLIKN